MPGPLNNAQLEALRFDTTNLSPKEQMRIKTVAVECNRAVLTSYQKFIQEPFTDEAISNRFLLMDSDTYDVFHANWINFPVNVSYSHDRDRVDLHSWLGNMGNFITGAMVDIYDKFPEENRKEVEKQFATVDEARQAANDVVLRTATIHEITHLYGDPDLPFAMKECGAYYYQADIMAKSNWGGYWGGDLLKRRADFYEQLIEKYGKDVHKVFFGEEINKRKKRRIEKEFSLKVTFELFPGMHMV